MRGADILVQSIAKSGTDIIFSVSGNQIMPIFDAVIDSKIKIVHCRHEASAVFMADGYSQTSGKVGIALVTAAPGFSNALGPLYAIKATQSAVVLLSGDSSVSQDGLMPFQELKQTKIAKGLVKKSWRILNPETIGHEIAKAISIAKTGRPGPVHLSLPFDILNSITSNINLPSKNDFIPKRLELNTASKEASFELINNSKKPLIISSSSLAESRNPSLIKDLSKTKIPVICMSSPRGLNDPAQGKIKSAINQADLIIFIDKDIDFTLNFGQNNIISAKSVIIVSDKEKTINHSKKVLGTKNLISAKADPLNAISYFLQIENLTFNKVWQSKVANLIALRPPEPRKKTTKLSPPQLCQAVVKKVNLDKTIFIIDGGEFGQWAQANVPINKMFPNGLSGAIGGSVSQAIGASFANPGKYILTFMGDGTAGFHPAEWETARRFNLPIIYVIGNDQRWGAEVEIQVKEYGHKRAKFCYLDNVTRYDKIAKAMGCKGFYVRNLNELNLSLEKALKSKKTTVIDVDIEGFGAPSFNEALIK